MYNIINPDCNIQLIFATPQVFVLIPDPGYLKMVKQ
jgi:hypothetical protein